MTDERKGLVADLREGADYLVGAYGHEGFASAIREAADYIESQAVAGEDVDLPDDLDTATLVLRSKLIGHGVYLSPHTCRQIAAAINTPQPAPVDAAEDDDGNPVGYADWYNTYFFGVGVNTQRDHWCEAAWRAALTAQQQESGL